MGKGSVGRDVMLETVPGEGIVREGRDSTDSARGKVVVKERREVSDIARQKGSFGRHVMLRQCKVEMGRS